MSKKDEGQKGHNLADLKKKALPALNDVLKAFDNMESDMGSHRSKIKDLYDKAASETGIAKRFLIRESARIRRRKKEMAEEMGMDELAREEIELLRTALADTPLGKFAEGLLAKPLNP